MRTSQRLLGTLKEIPADAEIISHQLMLRAGLIRRVAAGIYNWLPSGINVLRKVERIIREEMNRAGAQEVLLPAVQPAELWRESGRWEEYGPELLRFSDRHQRDFCLGPTHEEVITTLVKNDLRSYRQLPANFLPDSDQVPRRDSAAVRHHARAGIHYEGCLLLRDRPRLATAGLRFDAPNLLHYF